MENSTITASDVIPEFPSWTTIPLSMTATVSAAAAYQLRRSSGLPRELRRRDPQAPGVAHPRGIARAVAVEGKGVSMHRWAPVDHTICLHVAAG